MKLPRSFGKPKKLKFPRILVRQVVGESMRPALLPGRVIWTVTPALRVRSGTLVIVEHNGMEKIKRVAAVDPLKGVYVLGDNLARSTDSRSFGWLPTDAVLARVIWPLARSARRERISSFPPKK